MTGDSAVDMRRCTRHVAVLSCAVIAASACSGGGGGGSSPTAGAPVAAPTSTAIRNFGYGPATGGTAKYQPGVVVISEGAAAIRSATSDGLTWTIDRHANGASKLKVGSVMLATSRAAGRVVALQDQGDNRIVTLAPVELTDIVRDGTIDLDTNLSPSAFTYQVVPDLPGKVSQPTPDDTSAVGPQAATQADTHVVTLPTVRLVAAPQLPAGLEQSVEVPIGGGWSVEPASSGNQLGLQINHESDSGLKLSAALLFDADNLKVNTSEKISGGSASGYNFYLTGIKGLTINLSAGAGHGELDNNKIKIEVPIDIDIPIPPSPATAGIPLDVKIEFAVVVETALTGKNATLLASGQYKLSGPIGMQDGSVQAPTFSVVRSIIDSITGFTLGPSGVVVAVKMKIGAGVGTAAASAGPYGSVVTSIGVTNGSSLGAPLARCKSATLDMTLAGGVGLSIDNAAANILTHFLPAGTKIEQSLDLVKKNVLHRSQIVPDVPLCRA